jgi:two-component system cell cycle response regulator DivK
MTRKGQGLLTVGSAGKNMPKILLVEDNEMNRDMLSRRLMKRGYQVLLAVNGVQGVAMVLSEDPDLVLMDMSLPEMNGWDATKALKGRAETRCIPVIGLTAHAMEGDCEKAMAAGCDDYDTKPIDLVRLLEKIEVQLQKKLSA